MHSEPSEAAPALPLIIGIVNVTPDSFSDGGRYLDRRRAVEHGLRLRDQGADIIDVGGESTRPGADRVGAETEMGRVVGVVDALAAEGVPTSVDTTRAAVAEAALDAGAQMINDVSGGLADPEMPRLMADRGCPWVIMHWRSHSKRMQHDAVYGDVADEVRDELSKRVDHAIACGVAPENLILDPGLGFSKLPQHNWDLSANLDQLMTLGFPILFGASRKSYLGAQLAGADGEPRAVESREAATVATSVLAFEAGVWGVRVHDVQSNADARTVWRATVTARRRRARPDG